MPFRSLKIFIVENHEDTLTYLSEYLKNCGHKVLSARNMQSALHMLAWHQIDVLISDISLPDGDGWQLMRQIEKMQVPLPFGIAMSGYGSNSDMEKSRLAGYRHHLTKPFLPEELDLLISEASALLEEN